MSPSKARIERVASSSAKQSAASGKARMHFSLGGFSGGLAVVIFLSFLFDQAIFKKVFDDPVKRKVTSVILAWLVGGTIAGFAVANGALFNPEVYVDYGFAAGVIGCQFYYVGLELRKRAELAAAAEADEFPG